MGLKWRDLYPSHLQKNEPRKPSMAFDPYIEQHICAQIKQMIKDGVRPSEDDKARYALAITRLKSMEGRAA